MSKTYEIATIRVRLNEPYFFFRGLLPFEVEANDDQLDLDLYFNSETRPVSEAMQLTNQAVAEALDGLPDYKMHCSVLAEEAIRSALKNYEKKKK